MNVSKTILMCILADIDVLGEGIRNCELWASKRARSDGRTRSVAYQVVHCGAPYLPSAWADRPLTMAERQAFSRALRKLEADGLVVAVRSAGGRVLCVQLTPNGLIAALRLAPSANLDAIATALEATVWSTPEHLAALKAAAPQKGPNDD